MRNKKKIASGVAVALMLTAFASPAEIMAAESSAKESQERPNILWIMTEDINPRLGCYGDKVAVTPNIDAMAEEGVMYTNAYATAGVCAPSRAAIITGMYQQSFGAQNMATNTDGYDYRTVPDEEIKAFPEILRENGYYTFTCTKLDYQYSAFAAKTGPFTIWDNDDAALELWEGNDSDKPFFGYINMMDTHESQMFREPFEDLIKPEDVEVPPYMVDSEETREEIATLYNDIYHMDMKVKEIRDRLEEDGLADSTIVIFAADNGGCLAKEKRDLYDTGLHVPFVIYYPEKFRPDDVTPGSINDNMFSYVDVAPSILSLAGVEAPDYMQGQVSFGYNTDEPRQYIYAARDRLDECEDQQRAVRDNRYKYIYNYYPGTSDYLGVEFTLNLKTVQELLAGHEAGTLNEDQESWFEPRVEEELYDTQEDPYELHNLIDDEAYAEVRERMRNAYQEWKAEVRDMSDEMTEQEMIKLFFPDGEQPVTETPSVEVEDAGDGNVKVTVTGNTPGSSLGYKDASETSWNLYTDSITIPKDSNLIFKAVRYGYKESDPVNLAGEVVEDENKPAKAGLAAFGDIHFYKGFEAGQENNRDASSFTQQSAQKN